MRDVDAAVRRRERTEPARRLLELAARRDRPPAAGLVPRDGDVYESLVEVLLLGCGGAPRELEFLVRLEEAPSADQREALFKRRL